MRGRVLIPVHNEHGQLVAYVGRWPGESGWPEDTDKYMLPPKFQKTRVLLNLHRVLRGNHDNPWPGHEHHVVLVEGYFGALAVHPLAPCVSLMGSFVSDEHLALLQRADIRFVTLLLDGPRKILDPEQQHAWDFRRAETIRKITRSGLFVRSPELDVGEQPDTIERERLANLVAL
jgi:hypothetical protein